MESKTALYSTGNFAKLCGVTKDTILLYDKIGVLKPAITTSEGYRYYALRQTFLFNHIMALNQSGLTLQEIRDMFDETTEGEYRNMLISAVNHLKTKRNHLEQSIDFLETSIASITDSFDISTKGPYAVKFNLAQQSERCFKLCSEAVSIFDADGFTASINKAMQKVRDEDAGNCITNLASVSPFNTAEDSDSEILSDLCYRVGRRDADIVFKEGLYLTAIYRGDFQHIHKGYNALIEYAKEHQLKAESKALGSYIFVHHTKEKRLDQTPVIIDSASLDKEDVLVIEQNLRFETAATFNCRFSVLVDPSSFVL